jgi:Flp pilus assembly pilin Flp
MDGGKRRIWEFVRSEQGPTAVEYALMLAVVLIGTVVLTGVLGTKIAAVFADMEIG